MFDVDPLKSAAVANMVAANWNQVKLLHVVPDADSLISRWENTLSLRLCYQLISCIAEIQTINCLSEYFPDRVNKDNLREHKLLLFLSNLELISPNWSIQLCSSVVMPIICRAMTLSPTSFEIAVSLCNFKIKVGSFGDFLKVRNTNNHLSFVPVPYMKNNCHNEIPPSLEPFMKIRSRERLIRRDSR